MSGVGGDVDDDNSMQEDASHVDKPASSARFKRDADDERSPSSSSIERKDSVRARANMFAQLQEKAKASGGSGVATPSAINREDRSSPRRASLRVSSNSSSPQRDDLNASSGYRAANADEEFEPSSLPLSERLRFFSNLSDSGRNSYVSRGSPPQPHSCMNGSSVERSASASGYTSYFSPRSSISIGGSASVTPTPMECSLGATDIDDDDEEGDTDSVSTSIGLKAADGGTSDNTVSVGRVKRTTSAFLALNKSTSHSHVATLGVTAESSAAIDELTPVTRRIKLRTIGKLMLPQTFLNASDRNNNSSSARCYASDTSNSSDAELNRPPVKKIGKIKSPFIENCQQLQQEQQQQQQQSSKCRKYDLRSSPSYNYLHSPRDSSSGGGGGGGGGDLKLNGDITHADPGKENIDVSNSNASLLQQQDFQLPPIIEMRKKFTRMISGSNVTNDAPSSPRRQSMPTHRHSFNGSSHVVEERFAKYFGIASKAGGNHTLDEELGSGSTKNGRARGELRLQHNIDADKFMPDWTQQLPMRDSSSATNISRDARLLSNKTSSSSLATPKRRDSAKRSRPMTAIINGTPFAAAENTTVFAGVANGMAGAGTPGRVLRAGRSLTITNGIPYCQQAPEVKKFEDIMVTKEEFQLASKEFERIFLGLA